MAFRIGQFFIFIGLMLCLLFYATFHSPTVEANQNLLGYALIALTIGGFLIVRFRKPAEPSDRFRGYRKYKTRQADRKKAKEEKRKAKAAKKR